MSLEEDKLAQRRELLLELLPKDKVFRVRVGTDLAWAPDGQGYVDVSDIWDCGLYAPGEYPSSSEVGVYLREQGDPHSFEVDATAKVRQRHILEGSIVALLLDEIQRLREESTA